MKIIEDDILLTNININEFTSKIYSYYLEIFPEDERKPLNLIEQSYNNGYTKIIKISYKTDLVGFMLLNSIKDNGYSVLDYFAIFPAYRGKRYGSIALKKLIKQQQKSKGIFIEVDKIGLGNDIKENLIREKRKQFYERIGFKKLGFDLLLFDVIYMPYVYSNIEINEDHIINEILKIYETIVGKERISKNCKIIRDVQFKELNADNLKIAAKIEYEIFPDSSAYSVYKSKVTGTRDSFYTTYITYYEDKPIGVIGLYEIPEYPDTIWLSWFGLIKEYRKMGFGKQMLDFIIEVAKKNHRKFLRLYTFEEYNKEAQNFYKKNMDIEEYYYNEKEHQDIFIGKPKIFGKSLCSEKIELWNNKFINISEDEDSHEKSVQMMKEDGVI